MRPVSQAYIDALASEDVFVEREVSYKRRYWSASGQEYLWEENWTVLPKNQLVAISPITEQLDAQRLNEFKVSNITLTLLNHDNRWRADNPSGIFGPDSGSPLYPYSERWTKFRVRIGLKLQDGSTEYTARFVGLAVEYTMSSQDEVQINVQGLESLLQNANAENVSTQIVGENAGTGNGILTDFTTVHPGVGIVEEVSVAGIAKVAGTDYDISDLNDPSQGATITFNTPPASGTVRITYRYWQQNQTVESLVQDLLTEAGIEPGNQIVDPVLFPGGVVQADSRSSQSDWLAATSLSGLEASLSPGDVRINYSVESYALLDAFTDGDHTSNPTWNTGMIAGNNINVDASSGRLVFTRSGGSGGLAYAVTDALQSAGSWKVTVRRDGNVAGIRVFFMKRTSNPGVSDGYMILWQVFGGTLNLYSSGTLIATTSVPFSDATDYVIRFNRDRFGNISVYIDGVIQLSVSDATYTASGYIMLVAVISNPDTGTITFDDVNVPAATKTGTYVSDTIDVGTTPTAWGRITYDQTIVGAGSGTFYTRVSSDGVSWDADVAIAGNGQIQSALKRYLRVVWVATADTAGVNDAILHEFRLTYTGTSTTVTLANFTGKTVYDQIQEFGSFANYEWGFTPDEDFFFRAKEVNPTPDAVLTKGDKLLEINGLVSGWDRVYSEVRASYGAFTSIVRVAGDTEGDARAKGGSRILQVSGGDVLIADDANVAAGVAAGLAAEVRVPRKRMKAICKLLPHLDLSDVVMLNFPQNVPFRQWHHGDTTVYLGDQTLQHYGPKQQIVSETYAKVIGARHDPDNFKTELDLQEVPS